MPTSLLPLAVASIPALHQRGEATPRASTSLPLIFAAQVSAFLLLEDGPEKLLREGPAASVGHSQGVAAGLAVAACDDLDSFLGVCGYLLKTLVWLGESARTLCTVHYCPSVRGAF